MVLTKPFPRRIEPSAFPVLDGEILKSVKARLSQSCYD
jgi:hypothetical protein